jgi:hypothetical protein
VLCSCRVRSGMPGSGKNGMPGSGEKKFAIYLLCVFMCNITAYELMVCVRVRACVRV